jgi:hypothetical protein
MQRRRIMKIQSVSQILQATPSLEELPIIKAEEIVSILSLGIRGNIRLETEDKKTKNLVDMLA